MARVLQIKPLSVALVFSFVTALPGAAPRADEPPTAAKSPVTLCVQPLTPYDATRLPAVERGIRYVYGFDVKRLHDQPLPKSAWYEPRKRWRADAILDWMHEEPGKRNPECRYLVSFTKSDISTSKPPHRDWGILGLGEIGGRMAVVSSFRTHRSLRKPHTALRRTVKTVNHEIGHLMGLPHVADKTCLMQDAEGSVLTTDTETGLLCDSTIRFIERERGFVIPRHDAFDWSRVE